MSQYISMRAVRPRNSIVAQALEKIDELELAEVAMFKSDIKRQVYLAMRHSAHKFGSLNHKGTLYVIRLEDE